MAPEQEKTYAVQLDELNCQIAMLHERVYAERQVISTNTKPISLFASLVSPQFWCTALSEFYRSRGMLAELQYRLVEEERQRENIVHLLATHTSGLPRLPGNILWSILRSPRNPYKHYGVRQLCAFLKDTDRVVRGT